MTSKEKKLRQVDQITQEDLQKFNTANEGRRDYEPLRATLLNAWKRGVPTEDGPAVLNVVPKPDRVNIGYSAVCQVLKDRYPELKDEIVALEKEHLTTSEQHTVTVKLKVTPVSDVLKRV